MFKRIIATLICVTFSFSNLQYVQAQDFSVNQLPVPGTMVGESAPFAPLALKGLVVNLQKPLEFQFIVDTGKGPQDTASIKDQANQLVKYFLAGLTIPEGDLWVNLSPYEKNRMVPAALGQTDLGRDLLAQDYILKQLTASLIYPEKDLGKEFWSRVYAKAQQQFGTTNVPVNTFNKVWILPDQAQVFENVNAAYVTKSTLKVMLDEDYLALHKHVASHNGTDSIGSQIVRAIILPEITKEVNYGKNFAPLRQIYQALILAKWYKETIQNGLLDAVYTNKNKIAGVNLNDPAIKEQIYNRYLQAYKKGAFNYIKEDPTPDGQVVPRKYFSGGTELDIKNLNLRGTPAMISADGAMAVLTEDLEVPGLPKVVAMNATKLSAAMLHTRRQIIQAALLLPTRSALSVAQSNNQSEFLSRSKQFEAYEKTLENNIYILPIQEPEDNGHQLILMPRTHHGGFDVQRLVSKWIATPSTAQQRLLEARELIKANQTDIKGFHKDAEDMRRILKIGQVGLMAIELYPGNYDIGVSRADYKNLTVGLNPNNDPNIQKEVDDFFLLDHEVEHFLVIKGYVPAGVKIIDADSFDLQLQWTVLTIKGSLLQRTYIQKVGREGFDRQWQLLSKQVLDPLEASFIWMPSSENIEKALSYIKDPVFKEYARQEVGLSLERKRVYHLRDLSLLNQITQSARALPKGKYTLFKVGTRHADGIFTAVQDPGRSFESVSQQFPPFVSVLRKAIGDWFGQRFKEEGLVRPAFTITQGRNVSEIKITIKDPNVISAYDRIAQKTGGFWFGIERARPYAQVSSITLNPQSFLMAGAPHESLVNIFNNFYNTRPLAVQEPRLLLPQTLNANFYSQAMTAKEMAQDIVNTVVIPHDYGFENDRLVNVPGSEAFPSKAEKRRFERELGILVDRQLRGPIEGRYPSRSDEILREIRLRTSYRGVSDNHAVFSVQLYVDAAMNSPDDRRVVDEAPDRVIINGIKAGLFEGSVRAISLARGFGRFVITRFAGAEIVRKIIEEHRSSPIFSVLDIKGNGIESSISTKDALGRLADDNVSIYAVETSEDNYIFVLNDLNETTTSIQNEKLESEAQNVADTILRKVGLKGWKDISPALRDLLDQENTLEWKAAIWTAVVHYIIINNTVKRNRYDNTLRIIESLPGMGPWIALRLQKMRDQAHEFEGMDLLYQMALLDSMIVKFSQRENTTTRAHNGTLKIVSTMPNVNYEAMLNGGKPTAAMTAVKKEAPEASEAMLTKGDRYLDDVEQYVRGYFRELFFDQQDSRINFLTLDGIIPWVDNDRGGKVPDQGKQRRVEAEISRFRDAMAAQYPDILVTIGRIEYDSKGYSELGMNFSRFGDAAMSNREIRMRPSETVAVRSSRTNIIYNGREQEYEIRILRNGEAEYDIQPIELPGAISVKSHEKNSYGFSIGIVENNKFGIGNDYQSVPVQIERDGQPPYQLEAGKAIKSKELKNNEIIKLKFGRQSMVLRYLEGSLFLQDPYSMGSADSIFFKDEGGNEYFQIIGAKFDEIVAVNLSGKEAQLSYQPLQDEAMGTYVKVQHGLFKGLPDAVESLKDRDLTGVRVLLRTNQNVFDNKGNIQDKTRLEEALPILRILLDKGADVILIGHSGRLEDGKDSRKSLIPTEEFFQKQFPNVSVKFYPDSINNERGLNTTSGDFKRDPTKTGKGSLSILENLRFASDYEQGEKGNEKREQFGSGLAGLADMFIFEAFGDIASDGVSIEDLPRHFVSTGKEIFIGPRMIAEADKFANVASNGVNAVVMGGVKPDKVKLIQGILKTLRDNDFILLGSAPTSKAESDDLIRDIVMDEKGRVIKAIDYNPENKTVDIGPKTVELFKERLDTLKPGQSVLVNGTMGFVENKEEDSTKGTKEVFAKLGELAEKGVNIIFIGGDANANANKFLTSDQLKLVVQVTGGGVPLKIVAGKKLSGIEAFRDALASEAMTTTELKTDVSYRLNGLPIELSSKNNGTLLFRNRPYLTGINRAWRYGKNLLIINSREGIRFLYLWDWRLRSVSPEIINNFIKFGTRHGGWAGNRAFFEGISPQNGIFKGTFNQVYEYGKRNWVRAINGSSFLDIDLESLMQFLDQYAEFGSGRYIFSNWNQIGGVFLFDYRLADGQHRYIFLGRNQVSPKSEKTAQMGSFIEENWGPLNGNPNLKKWLYPEDFFNPRVYVSNPNGSIQQVDLTDSERHMMAQLEEEFFGDQQSQSYYMEYGILNGVFLKGIDKTERAINAKRFLIEYAVDKILVTDIASEEEVGRMHHVPLEKDSYFPARQVGNSKGKSIILRKGRVQVQFQDGDGLSIYREGKDIYVQRQGQEPEKYHSQYSVNKARQGIQTPQNFYIYQRGENENFLSLFNETGFPVTVTYEDPDAAMNTEFNEIVRELVRNHVIDLNEVAEGSDRIATQLNKVIIVLETLKLDLEEMAQGKVAYIALERTSRLGATLGIREGFKAWLEQRYGIFYHAVSKYYFTLVRGSYDRSVNRENIDKAKEVLAKVIKDIDILRNESSVVSTSEIHAGAKAITSGQKLIAGTTETGKKEPDKAVLAQPPGGIDLNQINVKRSGRTVFVQFDPAQLSALEQRGFKGFTPVITGFQYISSPFPLLGVNFAKESDKLAKV